MENLHQSLIPVIHTLTIIYTILAGDAKAQQFYFGDPDPKAACNRNYNSNPGSGIYLGYYSNGPQSCKTDLTIRSQYPYNTLSGITSLLSVDTDHIAQANDVVGWNKLVYIPVTCSCDLSLSPYYFKPTNRTVGPVDSYFHLANNTYQGLVTCQAIQFVNSIDQNPSNFAIGKTITIPLRCACPTIKQQTKGITSILSYVVGEGDTISSISTQLKVDSESIREANRLSENSVVYPFTTLLIPFTDDVVMNDDGSSSSSSSSTSSSTQTAIPPATATTRSTGEIIGIIGGISFFLSIIIAVLRYLVCRESLPSIHVRLNCCSNNNIFLWSNKVEAAGLPNTNSRLS